MSNPTVSQDILTAFIEAELNAEAARIMFKTLWEAELPTSDALARLAAAEAALATLRAAMPQEAGFAEAVVKRVADAHFNASK